MHMKNKWTRNFLLAVMFLAVSGAQADAYALDRFKDGGDDGYCKTWLIRDISVTASYVRFLGGSGDGYDRLILLGLSMPSRGLMIRIY